jgi:hypothetical protein
MRDPELSIAGWILIGQAKTLRERAFARLVQALHHDSIEFWHAPQQVFQIHPVTPTLDGLIYACAVNTWARDVLAVIPISRPPRSALSDPELVPMLQDLADIIAWEATQAFVSDYYPGIPDIVVDDDHVDAVMNALQREMDREGKSRQRPPAQYATLPRERQRALAERRRWWSSLFSITPERWTTGNWDLWEVSEEEMPEIRQKPLAAV